MNIVEEMNGVSTWRLWSAECPFPSRAGRLLGGSREARGGEAAGSGRVCLSPTDLWELNNAAPCTRRSH